MLAVNNNAQRLLYYILNNKLKIVVLALALILLFLVSRVSFIEVQVVGSAEESLAYTIINQSNGNASQHVTSAKKYKRLTLTSSYEISVEANGKSGFAVVSTKGFFRTASQQIKLQSERHREFVGKNPGTCANYGGSFLISFTCPSLSNTITKHVPASDNQPTYNQKGAIAIAGALEGVVENNQKTFALFGVYEDDESYSHTVYELNDNYAPKKSSGKRLSGLNPNKLYSVLPYLDGFIAYDNSFGFDEVFYYRPSTAELQRIDTTIDDERLMPISVRLSPGGSIGIVFSDAVKDAQDESSGGTNTGVLMISKDKNAYVTLGSKPYSDLSVCDQEYLCLLVEDRVEIYKIVNGKIHYQAKINNVQDMSVVNGNLLLTRGDQLLRYDVAMNEGFVVYSFKPYKPCGVRDLGLSNYLICVMDSNGKESALLIDPKEGDINGIDKKIAQIAGSADVKAVSAYKNRVFISPELGELIYRDDLNQFGYDPTSQKIVNENIKQLVDRVGVDQSFYKIINTLE